MPPRLAAPVPLLLALGLVTVAPAPAIAELVPVIERCRNRPPFARSGVPDSTARPPDHISPAPFGKPFPRHHNRVVERRRSSLTIPVVSDSSTRHLAGLSTRRGSVVVWQLWIE